SPVLYAPHSSPTRRSSDLRSSAEDTAWNTVLDVRLTAHPALSIDQQDVVRLEYFSSTSARVERCRAALLTYFIQDVRAATDPQRSEEHTSELQSRENPVCR